MARTTRRYKPGPIKRIEKNKPGWKEEVLSNKNFYKVNERKPDL